MLRLSVTVFVLFSMVFLGCSSKDVAVTYNADVSSTIKANNVKEYVESLGAIYEDMSIKEAEKFSISVSTLIFWEALKGGVVANGGSMKELNERIESDKSVYDLIKSSLKFALVQVSDLLSSPDFDKALLQQSLKETDAQLVALKESSKETYDITINAIKSFNGKTVKKVTKEADVILKRFDIKN